MQTTRIAALLIALSGLAFAAPASALANYGTWSFLRNTPAEHFTDEDWKMFKAAVNDALNEAADGETRAWENPATGASGELTILKTVRKGKADCREVKMTNRAKDRKRTSGQVFCISDDGLWKIAPGPRKSR